jgi:putative DNA methylase
LRAYGSDLNPVAVLISKALVEIPPKFAGKPPVNPNAQAELKRGGHWSGKGAQGLAEDVRYYGQWMRDEARSASAISTPRRNCQMARRRLSSRGSGPGLLSALIPHAVVRCH